MAPPHLHIDRFLPPTPIRVTVAGDVTGESEEVARRRVPGIIKQAHEAMMMQLGHEIGRLEALRKINPSVRVEEIDLLREQRRLLDEHLSGARLRLDALRLAGN
jgi:ATP-dependent helicase HepA